MLLKDIYPPDAREFRKDFFPLIKAGLTIDEEYGEADLDISYEDALPRLEKYIELFNKKYHGIVARLIRKAYTQRLHIYIKDRSLKDIFLEIVEGFTGLTNYGPGFADKFSISNPKFIDRITKDLYLFFDNGTTLILRWSASQKMVEICFDLKPALEEKTNEFKLCAFYALKEGFEKDIDLQKHIEEISFARMEPGTPESSAGKRFSI